jgi:hypothetical protein
LGRNRGKINRIIAALQAGLHVLADKPAIIEPADLPRLETALTMANEQHRSGIARIDSGVTAPPSSHAMPGPITLGDVERFFVNEAALLDERRLEEWLEVFTDDGCYLVPPLDVPAVANLATGSRMPVR